MQKSESLALHFDAAASGSAPPVLRAGLLSLCSPMGPCDREGLPALGLRLCRHHPNTLNQFFLVFFLFFLSFFFFFFFLSFVFLGSHPRHREVPRLGVKSELQLPDYTTATATPDPSHICDPHHSSWQCQICNPLSGDQGSNPQPHGS